MPAPRKSSARSRSPATTGASPGEAPIALSRAAIGARLRRLSAWIDDDATRVYADLGVAFEQRWFGVMSRLRQGAMTVGELATSLRITHASVSQTRTSLEHAGLVRSLADANDARRRPLTLTASGRRLADRLQPVWAAFDQVAIELDDEADAVVDALDRLDRALTRRSLYDRLMARPEIQTPDRTRPDGSRPPRGTPAARRPPRTPRDTPAADGASPRSTAAARRRRS